MRMPMPVSLYEPEVPKGLVVISHGSGGRPGTHQHLAEVLVGCGYVVAVPEHPGNHRGDNSQAQSLENFERRPRQLSEVIDVCQAEFGLLETVVVGHSLGGYTALMLAGAVADVMGQRVAGYRDERVKGLVLMAPSASWFGGAGALDGVRLPVLVFSGGRDTIAPAWHAEIVERGVAGARHERIAMATHYSFLSPSPVEDGLDRSGMFAMIREFVDLVVEGGAAGLDGVEDGADG